MKRIKSRNFNDIHFELLHNLYYFPQYKSKSRTGDMYEKIGVSFELTNPKNNTTKADVKYDYAEALYKFTMSGVKYVEDAIDFADKYPYAIGFTSRIGVPEGFSTAYGPKIQDQLTEVIGLLRNSPETRRAVIHILQPQDKLIWSAETTHEYPCCNSIQFLIRDKKLHMISDFRSNNLFKVLPYDVYIMTKLMRYVAAEIGLPLGSYYFNAVSGHVFTKDFDNIKTYLHGGDNL